MRRIDLTAASEPEAESLWPAVRAAHIYRDRDAYLKAWAASPWHVRVDARSRAVVVEPWRDGLDILAIRGIWTPGRDAEAVLEGVRAIARTHGFVRVLSPLIAEAAAVPYVRAGMREHVGLVASRLDLRSLREMTAEPVPGGVRIRKASPADIDVLVKADAACFDEFWAYERERIAEAVEYERVAVAESGEGVIGYTLCTVERGTGTLGRLGVVPHARARGVGTALVRDAVAYAAQAGADAVSLCTQEYNASARRLYARFGFRELPGRLVLLLGDA